MQQPSQLFDGAVAEGIQTGVSAENGAECAPAAGSKGPIVEQPAATASEHDSDAYMESLKRKLDNSLTRDGASDISRKSKRNKLLIPSGKHTVIFDQCSRHHSYCRPRGVLRDSVTADRQINPTGSGQRAECGQLRAMCAPQRPGAAGCAEEVRIPQAYIVF